MQATCNPKTLEKGFCKVLATRITETAGKEFHCIYIVYCCYFKIARVFHLTETCYCWFYIVITPTVRNHFPTVFTLSDARILQNHSLLLPFCLRFSSHCEWNFVKNGYLTFLVSVYTWRPRVKSWKGYTRIKAIAMDAYQLVNDCLKGHFDIPQGLYDDTLIWWFS